MLVVNGVLRGLSVKGARGFTWCWGCRGLVYGVWGFMPLRFPGLCKAEVSAVHC